METLGVDRIEAVADRGYFKIEDIEACDVSWRRYIPDMNGSHSFKEKQDDRFYPVCRSCNDRNWRQAEDRNRQRVDWKRIKSRKSQSA